MALAQTLLAKDQPVIPVGLDAYRQWDRWPLQRPGVRAYMRSTYDRAGGNEHADAAHFLYQLAEDRNVTLDVEGPGILYFARYNHWHGSPWIYEVDGKDHVVTETSTDTPDKPVAGAVFEPANAFPNPLTWTWSVTHGADLMWVPITFTQSFRMMYGRTFYGTGYYIYHQFDPGAPISKPLRAWDGQTPPAKDVLDLLARAGTDLIPDTKSPEGRRMKLKEQSGTCAVPANGAATLVATLENGPAMVRALQFSVKQSDAIDFGRARLRITWDDLSHASVDAPVALFYGAGTLYNCDGREFLVKAFPVNVRFDAERVHLSCFFPMPFARNARIELVNSGPGPIGDVRWSIRTGPLPEPMDNMGYFHATYRDHPDPVPGEDMVWLDTRETEGGGDWSGSFVGTSFIFTHEGKLGTLEGDPRFFFDDSETPQAYGTGTEEWGGGGDYWGGRNMTLPLAGHPCGTRKPEDAKNLEGLIHSAYRFLLADLMPFGKNAVIRFEHGGTNEAKEHYETVVFWYGVNRPLLVHSDRLQIGDPAREEAHNYVSNEASPPYEIVSRYEWGIDTLKGREIYPTHTDRGRKTTGSTEFTLAVNPANTGILLRRKLDYQFPNQRAIVSIAPVDDGKAGEFVGAGVWFLAGSNTTLFSNVKTELAPSEQVVQTSNRRFRDDEFLIPRSLTNGQKQIRVRIQFEPADIPLLPGQALPEQAWSEIRYDAYNYVLPH